MIKNTKLLTTISCCLSVFLVGCNNASSTSITSTGQKEFEGITYSDKTFDYDGNSHSIFCDNVPSFANVTYDGNNKVDPGVYTVSAHITANEYKPLDLTAKMTIYSDKKVFENLKFENLTVNYDGEVHTILVQNAPSFATIQYKNNSKTAVGTYNATATVSAEGYITKTLSATLTIKANDFTGIAFKSQTFSYDGYYHSIYVEGAPEFATVTYEGNNKSEVGTYTVKATIKATGYNTKTMSATMKIAKVMPTISTLVDRTLIYNGKNQLVYFEYPKNLPYGSTATFKINGQTVADRNSLRVKNVGEYEVSVTLACEEYSYEPTTTTAKVSVIANNIGQVDQSKTALQITNNLKYKTLRSEILKGNFSVKIENYDDYYYPDSTQKHELSDTTYIYVANGDAFKFYYSENEIDADQSYRMYESYYRHSKIVGNDVLSGNIQEGLYVDFDNFKYPSSAYSENIIGDYGIQCMAYLKEASDGGFENSQEGGSATKYGSYKINPSENTFTMEAVEHYYHTEWNHDDRSVYTIYNIGNTKINMIDDFSVEKIPYEKFELYKYKLNGFEYRFTKDGVCANVSFDAIDCTYLEKGSYIVPATLNGSIVSEFTTGYYDYLLNQDCSGYTLKLYCNNKGVYQGDYASLGSIKGFNNIGDFLDDGGNVLYYGEW